MSARITPDGEVILDYDPPKPARESTFSAFQAIRGGPSVSLGIAPDPLGPVNRILSLVRNDRGGSTRLGKSVLYPIRAGQAISLVRDEGGPRIRAWSATWDDLGEPFGLARVPGWRVEIDERTVLAVTDDEMRTPYVPPRVPLRRRLRSWATRHARTAADRLAGRLGYHREDECGGDW